MRRTSRTCGRIGWERGTAGKRSRGPGSTGGPTRRGGGEGMGVPRQPGGPGEPMAGVAYTALAAAALAQGRLDEAEEWTEHAERTLHEEVEPAAGLMLHHVRGGLEIARGRNEEALVALRSAEQLATRLVTPHTLTNAARRWLLQTLVRMGETDEVERAFAEMDAQEREAGELHTALAALRLAQGDPAAATIALAPVLDSSAPVTNPNFGLSYAFLLEAIARDRMGEEQTAEH